MAVVRDRARVAPGVQQRHRDAGKRRTRGRTPAAHGVRGVPHRAGTEGVLAHTYLANSITGVWLNGVRASEGLLNAHVAAEYRSSSSSPATT
ncbi:hypothetical protein SBADM41S_06212 [Streptomyces badius]